MASRELEELVQANWPIIDSTAIKQMGDYNDAIKTLTFSNQDMVLWQSRAIVIESPNPVGTYVHEHRSNVVRQTPAKSLMEYRFYVNVDRQDNDIVFGFFNLSDANIELVVWIGCSNEHYITVRPQHFVPFLEGKYPHLHHTGMLSSRRVYCKSNPNNLVIVNGLIGLKIRTHLLRDFKMWNTSNTMTGTLFVADTDTMMLHYNQKNSVLPSIDSHLSLPDLSFIHHTYIQRKKAACTILNTWMDRSSNPKYKYCQDYQRRKFYELKATTTA